MMMILQTATPQQQQQLQRRLRYSKRMNPVCFVLTLLLTITSNNANASCSVCGDGKEVGKPDAIFKSNQPDVACGELQGFGVDGLIQKQQCDFLPTLIGVCECTDIPSAPTKSPVDTPTKSPVDTPTKSPVDTPTPCSVCGDGKEVGEPDAIFEFPGQPVVSCGKLQDAGANGVIPTADCNFLPTLIGVCECTDIPSAPTKSPVDTPTKSPVDTPTKSPVDTPTKSPVDTPTKSPVKEESSKTDSPKPSPSPSDLNPTQSPTATLAPSPAPSNPNEPTIEPLTEAPVTASPIAPTVQLPLTKRPRCGFNWGDANRNCYDFCTSGADCKGGRDCFQDMSFACPVKSLKRCGKNYGDANANCYSYCEVNADCFPKKCYAEVEDICQARCGRSWDEADGQCSNQCRTLETVDCPEGQRCFLDMVRRCSKNSGAATARVVMMTLTLAVVSVLFLW